MRSDLPSLRWRKRWVEAHRRHHGHDGRSTLEALYPRAVELYHLGASAEVAGSATAREYHLHSSAEAWRELAGED